MRFFLAAFLTFHFLFCDGQHYNAFPEAGAVWEVTYYYPPQQGYQASEHIWYSLEGKTTIDNITYNQLFVQGYHHLESSQYGVDEWTKGTKEYIGALRQDTLNRQVFMRLNGWNVDSLLYDFSLKIGDTLKASYVTVQTPAPGTQSFVPIPQDIVISAVDSVLSPWNVYYRQFLFDTAHAGFMWFDGSCFPPAQPMPANSGYLVEGMGSAWGLLQRLYSTYQYTGYILTYFCDNRYYNCRTRPGLEPAVIKDDPAIYPNPFTSKITLSTSRFPLTLEIYNALGERSSRET